MSGSIECSDPFCKLDLCMFPPPIFPPNLSSELLRDILQSCPVWNYYVDTCVNASSDKTTTNAQSSTTNAQSSTTNAQSSTTNVFPIQISVETADTVVIWPFFLCSVIFLLILIILCVWYRKIHTFYAVKVFLSNDTNGPAHKYEDRSSPRCQPSRCVKTVDYEGFSPSCNICSSDIVDIDLVNIEMKNNCETFLSDKL